MVSQGNQSTTSTSQSISYLVISGGTGCNSILPAFGDNVAYVLPVSDNGGSSSEIMRVLGGPSLGDIRSRLIRLIPGSTPDSPIDSIRQILSHRIPPGRSEQEARQEWRDIVEGESSLWTGVPPDRKETIRGFLVYFESELLRCAHKKFSFRNGSIGNYFLAAAHRFFGSVPSAIFLFSSITGSQATILPALLTDHAISIAAELANGSTIIGQCEISHPVSSLSPADVSPTFSPWIAASGSQFNDKTSPPSRNENALFAKTSEAEYTSILESPIRRLYYINTFGQEVFPVPNPESLVEIARRDVLVYSVGSLWTSIIPCLALTGVGEAISGSTSLKAKILLLNGKHDRETWGYTAVDYVLSISSTLDRTYVNDIAEADYQTRSTFSALAPQRTPSRYVSHLIYPSLTSILVDEKALSGMGIQCIAVPTTPDPSPNLNGDASFRAEHVRIGLDAILKDIKR